jgi:hypothetical protein
MVIYVIYLGLARSCGAEMCRGSFQELKSFISGILLDRQRFVGHENKRDVMELRRKSR